LLSHPIESADHKSDSGRNRVSGDGDLSSRIRRKLHRRADNKTSRPKPLVEASMVIQEQRFSIGRVKQVLGAVCDNDPLQSASLRSATPPLAARAAPV
jgi:hypothetical protein